MNPNEIANAKAKIHKLSYKIGNKTRKINIATEKRRLAQSQETRSRYDGWITRLTNEREKLWAESVLLQNKLPQMIPMRRRNGQMARCIGCGKQISTDEIDWRTTDNYVIELQPLTPSKNHRWYERYVHNFCQPILEQKKVAMRKRGNKVEQ